MTLFRCLFVKASIDNRPLVEYPSTPAPQRLHASPDHTHPLRCLSAVNPSRPPGTEDRTRSQHQPRAQCTDRPVDDCPLTITVTVGSTNNDVAIRQITRSLIFPEDVRQRSDAMIRFASPCAKSTYMAT